MITAQQLARLPMYAQDEIQRLRRKLREAEADRDAARLTRRHLTRH